MAKNEQVKTSFSLDKNNGNKYIKWYKLWKIYNTIIKPHFEFGSTIIYTCCNETQLNRFQKLQNKSMRAILEYDRYTSIQFMLNTLKWLNIKQRLALNTLKLIYKIKNGNAPIYLYIILWN